MRHGIMLAVWIGLAACPVAAQAEAPVVRDLVRLVGLSDPHVSPDGKSVVYVERRAVVPLATAGHSRGKHSD